MFVKEKGLKFDYLGQEARSPQGPQPFSSLAVEGRWKGYGLVDNAFEGLSFIWKEPCKEHKNRTT